MKKKNKLHETNEKGKKIQLNYMKQKINLLSDLGGILEIEKW